MRLIVRRETVGQTNVSSTGDLPGIESGWLGFLTWLGNREGSCAGIEHGRQIWPARAAAEAAFGLKTDFADRAPAVDLAQAFKLCKGPLVAHATGDTHG